MCGKPAEENHHPAGSGNEPDITAPLCKDCHLEQTKLQRVAGVDLSHNEKPFLEKLPAILLGFGILLIAIGKVIVLLGMMMVEYGKKHLPKSLQALDLNFCEWRAVLLGLSL